MALLPDKLEKLYALAESLIAPAALRAAGPVLMNLKGQNADALPGEPTKSELFHQQFTEALHKSFETITEARKPASAKPADKKKSAAESMEERISKYSLVSTAELETQLAAEKQGRSLYNDNAFGLSCLSMRMEKLIGKPFLLADCPLHPQKLSLLFSSCAEKSTDNQPSSLAAINNWGLALEKAHASWLEELNNALIKQRILPNLDQDDVNDRYKHSHEAERNRARTMRQTMISEVTGKPAEGSEAAQPQEMMQGIARLLKEAGIAKPEMQSHMLSNENGPAIDTAGVLEVLRTIPTAAKINPETGYREQLPEQSLAELIKTTTNLSSASLNERTQSSIALLSMMFSRLEQEDSIAGPMKPLINDLQLPILNRALQDDGFFADAENSAQQLVNEIAKAGAHWTPKQNASRDPLYKKVVSIIEDIKARFDGEDDVFDENLQVLNEFLEREERRSGLLEERIIEAEEAKGRAEAARARVKSAIHIRSYNKIIPPVTQRFLDEQWESVLFFHINKDDGDDSPELQQALYDLDQLLEASSGEKIDLKSLFQSMNKQMVDIGLERGDREQLLKDLLQELKIAQVKAVQAAALAPTPETQQTETKTETKTETETETVQGIEALTVDVEQTFDDDSEIPEDDDSTVLSEDRPTDVEDTALSPAVIEQAIEAEIKIPIETATETAIGTATSQAPNEPETILITPVAHATIISQPDSIAFTPSANQNSGQADIPLDMPAKKPVLVPPQPVSATSTTDEIEDEYTLAASSIRVNSWLHLKLDEESNKQKIKLAAIIKHNGSYIFVNREGVKILVTNRKGVADSFREGKLTIVEDAVFFDRALEAVISSLRA